MSIFSTQSVIPNTSGLLELPAGSRLNADPIGPSAKEVVESVLTETAGPQPQDEVSDQEIAVEAFFLFEARGFEHGHDVEDWLAAEALVRQRRTSRLPPYA